MVPEGWGKEKSGVAAGFGIGVLAAA